MNKTFAISTALLLAFSYPVMAASNPADPYESYNRMMYKINDTADHYVLEPVAKGYRAITPKPVKTGVSNFFNNLRDVVSFGSNLLRLDLKRASEDLVRVGLNTTFGLGGLIDFADAGGMPNNKNTLGDTFSSWGWKNSNYFVYPLLGPSTVRDSIGSTITSVYPVKNAIFETPSGRVAATVVDGVNTREQLLDLTDSLNEAAIDKYAYTRDIFMKMRRQQTGAQAPQGTADDNIDIDDLVADKEDGASTTAKATSTTASDTASNTPAEAATSEPIATAKPVDAATSTVSSSALSTAASITEQTAAPTTPLWTVSNAEYLPVKDSSASATAQ